MQRKVGLWFLNTNMDHSKLIAVVTNECRPEYEKEINSPLAKYVQGDSANMIFARTSSQTNIKRVVSDESTLGELEDRKKR